MGYRRRILRQLLYLYNKKGPNNFFYADQLDGFTPGNQEFMTTLNQLLQEKLIKGVGAEEIHPGQIRVVVTLNEDRLDEIHRELTPWWKDVRFIILIAIALAGLVWGIVSVFL